MLKRIFIVFFALWLVAPVLAYAELREIVFPVNGTSSFRDDFSEPRGGGTREHLGIDIIAAKMTPVVAAVDGTVTYVVSPQASWGYAISIRDADGYQYRYLHLNNDTPGTDDGQGGEANAYVAGMRRGVRVVRGEHIGWVGDSGNAEGTVSHLHFEIRDASRVPINPYESLVAAAAKSSSSISIQTGATPAPVVHQSDGDQGLNGEGTYFFTGDLSFGDRGEAVRELQLRLQALGYFTSYVTDYFGPLTRDAVISFQRAQGIDPIGIVGPKTRAALNQDVASTPPTSGSGYVFIQTLSLGSRGEEVYQLQMRLNNLGYFHYPLITNYFGSFTRDAVVSFQRAKGIDPIGIVGPKTRAALNAK